MNELPHEKRHKIETDEKLQSWGGGPSVVACPQCSQMLRIPAENRAMRLRCRVCGEIFKHDGRIDLHAESPPKKAERFFGVIGIVLGIGGALLGALVLTLFTVPVVAWFYTSVVRHGQILSDNALWIIGILIRIFIVLLAFGGWPMLQEIIGAIRSLLYTVPLALRRFLGNKSIPPQSGKTDAPAGNPASELAGFGSRSGQQGAPNVKTFAFGMALGLATYLLYLKFLAADELTALSLGWIFFIPQYFVSWCGSLLNAPASATLIASCLSIVLFSGFVCSSVRRFPLLALRTALSSAVIFLLLVCFQNVDSTLLTIVRAAWWPAKMLSLEFDYLGFYYHWLRIFLECATVACWHAGLICSTRTLLTFTSRTSRCVSI